MSHVTECFEAAAFALVGEAPIKHRLAAAYTQFLDPIDTADLPTAVRAEFGSLRAALNRVTPIGKETAVKASVQKMSFAEAERHATVIVKLYAEMARQVGRAEPLKVVAPAGKPLPRYLANG